MNLGGGLNPLEVSATLPEMQTIPSQVLLPNYMASGYSTIPMTNVQQNNAMPLMSLGRHGSMDNKSYAYIQALPQALLGPPPPHIQPSYFDCLSSCYNNYFRAHPYSFIRRSSTFSQRHPIPSNHASRDNLNHVNNHSSTEQTGIAVENNVADLGPSRSSSNCSNQHQPMVYSPKPNQYPLDSAIWRNASSMVTPRPISSADLPDEIPARGNECITGNKLLGSENETWESRSDSLVEAGDAKKLCIDHPIDSAILSSVQSPEQSCGARFVSDQSQQHSDCITQNPTINSSPPSISDVQTHALPDSHSVTQNLLVSVPLSHIQQMGQLSEESDSQTQNSGDSPQKSASICVTTNSTASVTKTTASTNASITNVVANTANSTVVPNTPVLVPSARGIPMIGSRSVIPAGAPLSFSPTQPNGMQFTASPLSSTGYMVSSSLYMEALSLTIWQFYTSTRQSTMKYTKKVQLRDALHMVVSGVFENAGLFIVGSSMNGFGSDESDMDMCLTVTSRDLQQKKEAFVVLSQLLPPLRKCSFIKNLHLIRAKVPILKFRDTLAEVDCDLNVNNVVGIYNTHLLAMYTRIDWRVRPLGMFVKHWAQRMDIHDGSRGRLSTYPLLLMLIQYLQASCSPPILPNLQAKFPKIFNYTRPLTELDMRLELPWAELRSNNPASLAELFVGFIHYYTNEFDFNQWAVSIRHGSPLPIDLAIRRLPPHEQAHTARSFKVFVEEPFCRTNAARSLYDDNVLTRIRQAFIKTNQALRSQRPLESVWASNTNESN